MIGKFCIIYYWRHQVYFCTLRYLISPFLSGSLVMGARDLRKWSTTLEIKIHDSANGQKCRTVRCDIYKRPRETLPSLLYPMKTKMQNIKKVYFRTKLFKNTIFIMYGWWRFQRYRICLKKSEIKIGIQKLNFFVIHLVRSIQTKLKLDNKLKIR